MKTPTAILLLFVAACRPVFPPPSVTVSDAAPGDDLARLSAELGDTFAVRREPLTGAVTLLTGRSRPLAATPSDATRVTKSILDRYPALFGRHEALSLRSAATTLDDLGFLHATLALEYAEGRVLGGVVMAHFSPDGELFELRASAWTPPPANRAVLDADAARTRAALDTRDLRPGLPADRFESRTPALWILPLSPLESRVVWRVPVSADDSVAPLELTIFVDAESGDVVRRHDELRTIAVEAPLPDGKTTTIEVSQHDGRYFLDDELHLTALKTYGANTHPSRSGTLVEAARPELLDPDAVAVHANLAAAYAYFATVHGVTTWSDGDTLRATVHYGSGYANAFFDGRRLVFGDGGGATPLPLGRAADVVAHEVAHSIMAQLAPLLRHEATASVDEGLADLFAALARSRVDPLHAWEIGRAVRRCDGAPCALRDLAFPAATGNLASVLDYDGRDDDPHRASTIVSHAGYLMAVGDSSAGVVTLGVDTTEQVWFRAARYYLPPDADFQTMAEATVAAAKDLSVSVESVRAAWSAVGVEVGGVMR